LGVFLQETLNNYILQFLDIKMIVLFMRQAVFDILCLHDFHLMQGVLAHQNRHYSLIERNFTL